MQPLLKTALQMIELAACLSKRIQKRRSQVRVSAFEGAPAVRTACKRHYSRYEAASDKHMILYHSLTSGSLAKRDADMLARWRRLVSRQTPPL